MLMKVPKFDIVKSFVTEYMLCLQGIMKGMLSFWFDSRHHEESYYLGRIVACIDRELNEIKPPNEISRLPSAVSCRQQWKASEYRSFLLYYGPVVLKCKLPSAYYTHFMMLSRSIYLLLQETIQEIQLESIHHELQMFVQAFERLYGKESVTYNVHQLSHFVANVRCWGPLWAYSAFPFESMNHTMLKMKHGTQHTAMQIANAGFAKNMWSARLLDVFLKLLIPSNIYTSSYNIAAPTNPKPIINLDQSVCMEKHKSKKSMKVKPQLCVFCLEPIYLVE